MEVQNEDSRMQNVDSSLSSCSDVEMTDVSNCPVSVPLASDFIETPVVIEKGSVCRLSLAHIYRTKDLGLDVRATYRRRLNLSPEQCKHLAKAISLLRKAWLLLNSQLSQLKHTEKKLFEITAYRTSTQDIICRLNIQSKEIRGEVKQRMLYDSTGFDLRYPDIFLLEHFLHRHYLPAEERQIF